MRFHVEHLQKKIKEALNLSGSESNDITGRLILFGRMIHSENSKFNLTGHKTPEDILFNLIIDSLSPLSLADVPRGTSAADMGTGAGIPGIPLSILYSDINFTLFDSNSKKIRFIEHAIRELEIKNANAVCARIEEASRENKYREHFGIVVSRAMSDIYMASELCSPFVKPGGYIYLYVSEKQKQIPPPLVKHLADVSLETAGLTEYENSVYIKHSSGLLLKKTSPVADIYPRRISAIKRGAADIEKNRA